MSNHTNRPVKVLREKLGVAEGGYDIFNYLVVVNDELPLQIGKKYQICIVSEYTDGTDKEEEANAELIAECFNVAYETNLTPRQLKDENYAQDVELICLRAREKELKEQRDELLNTMEKIKTMTTNAGIKFIINKAICKQD